jgi:plastocyanin
MVDTFRRASALALILAAAAFAGACGDDDEEPSAGGGDTAAESAPETTAAEGGGDLQLTAVEEDGLSFDPAELSAGAGTVTITMENPEGNQMPHTVAIEGEGVEESGENVEAGATATVTADLQPGTYTFYCPVGQHRQNGMEGTLTVE